MTWFFKIIRQLFGQIDSIIYSAIQQVFQLIFDLSNVEIFNGTTINKFASRIYIILGLIMVFKLMISFIQIIINPDKMDDKEKGIGNIIGRVVFSIALIVFVPSIFSLARQIQTFIIPVIPRVFIGRDFSKSINGTIDPENIGQISERMSYYMFLPFFDYDNPSCNDGSILGVGSEQNITIFTVSSAVTHSTDTDTCSTDDHGFKYSYRYILSTLVGGYALFVIIQIAVTVAIRAVKLAVCEFVAPIPIASYIDPKNSEQTFKKWVSVSFKTYTDLFIRLILVYFMIFVFDVVISQEGTIATITSKVGNDTFRTSLVILFIIVGLLQFVKTAPKFISDLLGLKEGGDLMGMFRGEGMGQIGGVLAPGAAAISAGAANFVNGRGFRRVTSMFGGATSALLHGGVSALRGQTGGQVFNHATQTAFTNRQRRAIDRANGLSGPGGWVTRQRVRLGDWAQMQDAASLDESRRQALNNMDSAASGFTNAVIGRIGKDDIGYKNGNSEVIDAMAAQVERVVASSGASSVRDFLTNAAYASQRTPAMERFMSRFALDARGNIARNAGRHASFVAGRNIGANDLQSVAESLQGTELGGFMDSDYLRNLSNREIRDDVFLHRAVTTDGTTLSAVNDQRDVRNSRSNMENVYRVNLPNVGAVPNGAGGFWFSGNYDEDYTVRSATGFGAVVDPIREAQNIFNSQLADQQNARVRAARESNAARAQNRRNNSGGDHH